MPGDTGVSFSGWMALIAVIMTGLGWVGGWAFSRGRNAQSTDDNTDILRRIELELREKERRVDGLDVKVARLEARLEHMAESIKRAETYTSKLTSQVDKLLVRTKGDGS